MDDGPRLSALALPSPRFTVDFCPNSSMRNILEIAVKHIYCSVDAAVDRLPPEVLGALYYAGICSMRIAELLNLTWADHLGNGQFIVRGLKKSRSYTVWLPVVEIPADVTAQCVRPGYVVQVGYKTVWAWCRRVGIGTTPHGRKTPARTHAHRYHTARAVMAVAGKRAAGETLHHRSQRSVESYIV